MNFASVPHWVDQKNLSNDFIPNIKLDDLEFHWTG